MTVAADLAAATGTRRRLALLIDGVEPIFWQPVGVGVDDVHVFDPPGRLPMSPDCVAKWTMNGTVATADEDDATGHGHTAVQTGSPTVQTGKFGGARGFASGDYLTVADVASLHCQRLTVAAWVYYDGNTGLYPKVFHYDHPTRDQVIVLHLGNGTKKLGFQVYWTDGTSSGGHVASIPDLSTGWHLVGGTYDGHYVRSFIDGSCVYTSPLVEKTIDYSTDYLTLGNDRDDPTNQYWRGYIDETAFYNTAKPQSWWAQAYAQGDPETRSGLCCLIPPSEASMGIDMREMRLDWAGMTFELIDAPDPDSPTESYFAKTFAPARWDNRDHWRAAWGTSANSQIDANATSIVFDDVTDLPTSGTLHLGQEILTYTGISTKTITGVQKGLYPAVAGVTYWGQTYPLPLEDSGVPALAAGEVPFSLHGRRVALYETTFDKATQAWNVLSSAKLVWTGRISDSINYVPGKSRGAPRTWQLSCTSVTTDLDRKLAGNLPSAKLAKGINLTGDAGRTFTVDHYNNGVKTATMDVTVDAGFYTAKDLATELNNKMLTAAAAASLGALPGLWDVNIPSTYGSYGSGPYEMKFYSLGATGALVFRDRLNMVPCHVLNALGFTSLFSKTVMFSGSDDDIVAGVVGEDPFEYYHPLDQRVNGSKLYVDAKDIGDLWPDQGDDDSAAAVVMIENSSPMTASGGVTGRYLARYTAVESTYLTLTTDPLQQTGDGFVGATLSEEVPVARQVYVPTYKTMAGVTRGPFGVLLFPLLSTGTTDYNGEAYDKCPLQMSCGAQASIVDTDSFLAADEDLSSETTAQRYNSTSGCYVIDEPLSFSELLQRECALYGYCLCWRRSKLTLTAIAMPAIDEQTETLDASNAAVADEMPTVQMPLSTVVNRYECEVMTNHYTGDEGRQIIVTDPDSVAGLGGFTSAVTIKHPGIPSPGGAGAPDPKLLSSILQQLLVGNRGLRYPSQIVERTINCSMEYSVFVGDVVAVSLSHVPDPFGDGDFTYTGYAQLLNKAWDYERARGVVSLRLLSQYVDYGKPWAPSALVDISAANGGYTANTALVLVASQYSPVVRLATHDGERFAAGDIVRVVERDALGPTEATGLTVVSYTVATRVLLLADDAAAAALAAAWDDEKEWVVLYDDYSSVTAAQKAEAYQASAATHKIGSVRADRWG